MTYPENHWTKKTFKQRKDQLIKWYKENKEDFKEILVNVVIFIFITITGVLFFVAFECILDGAKDWYIPLILGIISALITLFIHWGKKLWTKQSFTKVFGFILMFIRFFSFVSGILFLIATIIFVFNKGGMNWLIRLGISIACFLLFYLTMLFKKSNDY